jgi:ribosomal protein L32
MNSGYVQPEDLTWKCQRCNEYLIVGTVTVTYLGNQFTTELPKCPRCGMVLISETLALGKMAEVEQILEDK